MAEAGPHSSKDLEGDCTEDHAELPGAVVADTAKEVASELTALGSEFSRLLDPAVWHS